MTAQRGDRVSQVMNANSNHAAAASAALIFLVFLGMLFALPRMFELYATHRPWGYDEWCPKEYSAETCDGRRIPLQWEFSEFQ